jgi:segregation and condensation protein B
MDKVELKNIVQAIIQASPKSVTLEELCQVFTEDKVDTADIQEAVETLLKMNDPVQELKAIAGGYRYHIRGEFVPWVQRAQDPVERADPLPRALVETLAIIAYKQPISRGEVDLMRGKQSAWEVFEQLEERGWIKVVAYGGESRRAALYGTTMEFLAYFGLNSIHDLPELEQKLVFGENKIVTLE